MASEAKLWPLWADPVGYLKWRWVPMNPTAGCIFGDMDHVCFQHAKRAFRLGGGVEPTPAPRSHPLGPSLCARGGSRSTSFQGWGAQAPTKKCGRAELLHA